MISSVPTKKATTVRLGSREVRLTNLDKPFFPAPGLTKGDLIRKLPRHGAEDRPGMAMVVKWASPLDNGV